MKKTFTRLTALALALNLLLTSCGSGASAATMHLRKTEGTVAVSDSEGKDVVPRENLGLYSGYQVGTQAESYAWIDLDKVKLTKMDADSEIEITKDGEELEINVKSGSLFFNVTEPLADDETMNIRTSTMMIGIRGTCGWVTEDTAALLEGTVSVTAGDQEVTVNAGEMAVLTEEGTLEVKPFTAMTVPAFVREEIADDKDLAAEIQDATGMDLTGTDPLALYSHVMAQDFSEVQYTEFIDFAQDGDPELLVIGIGHEPLGGDDSLGLLVRFQFYRAVKEGEGYRPLPLGGGYGNPMEMNAEQTYSLVELDGRLFLKVDLPAWNRVGYYGFTDKGQWTSEHVEYDTVVGRYYYTLNVLVDDRMENTRRESSAEEFAAIQAKYRDDRILMHI